VAVASRLAVALAGAAAFAVHAQAPAPEQLVRQGEERLAARDPAAAEALFDRAAAMQHASEIEASLVRAYVQAGAYRRALAFAAHAAGAHSDYPQASALYAWLLYMGGQREVAGRLLDSAQAGAPDDDMLRAVRERFAQPWPMAEGTLLEPPVRLAPYADATPATGVVVASATLIDGGNQALTSAAAIDTAPGGGGLWVRNGVGQTVRATLERRLEVAGGSVALLRLDGALPAPQDLAAAGRAPFAGSVGYAVEFAPAAQSATPAWPVLRIGFFGRAASAAELPVLGIDVPPGLHGGPVFDEAGRIVGIAMSAGGRHRLVPAASLPQELGATFGTASLAAPTPRMTIDLIYERSLLLTLQLIAEPEPSSRSPSR
jgi:opacity protein-like surface antigen